ncbi:MAG: hypothetical protein CVV44_11230 [Spirochaetae bacterium HGW-Spirochaetae-1]|jgi:hypothetical protein|nr:MAG: hypothetical protein CVV44_11230 [Spirochaetae bacterium HGW-Spirochaetae-1]
MKKYSIGISSLLAVALIFVFSAGCSSGGSSDSKYPEKSAIGSFPIDGMAYKSFLSGSTIYVTYGKYSLELEYGIYAINISDPATPSLNKKITTPDNVEGLAFDSDKVYVLHLDWDEGRQWYSKLIAYDASLDPTTDSIDFDNFGTGVAVSNGYAFISFADSSTDSMRIIDLSTFTEEETYPLDNGSYHIRVNGSRAYLSGQSVALEIVDITDPESPEHIGSYDNPFGSAPQDLYIYDNYALLSSGSYGVAIIDISDEYNPAFIEFNDEPGYAKKITAAGSMVFLADQDSGVIVIDASSGVDNFVVKGICKTSFTVQDMCVSGNYVYAVSTDSSSPNGNGLLEVFDISSWQE